MARRIGIIVLGNQLIAPGRLLARLEESFGRRPTPAELGRVQIYLREDVGLCTYERFHQIKIAFFLTAMRAYAAELKRAGFSVHYERLEPRAPRESSTSYEHHALEWLRTERIEELYTWEIEDRGFESRLHGELKRRVESSELKWQEWESPLFLTSRARVVERLAKSGKRPLMKTFYEAQRRELGILMTERGLPVGGQFSFDADNRLSLPADVSPPEPTVPERSRALQLLIKDVCTLVCARFADHPGFGKDAKRLERALWMPLDREGAAAWLDEFVRKRLREFGPYEDAITERSDFVFHSALSPLLNVGLLEPQTLIDAVLEAYHSEAAPIASVEGIIRQVIGWREFIRGVDRVYGVEQERGNFWKHHRRLAPCWYDGKTQIPVLDRVIRKTQRLAYAHHIERLMVVGSLMLLLEIEPRDAYRWFMEMFVDSSDWVMGPNVYGMALYSDGGIFATKPYICGSNYYRKMGSTEPGDWRDEVDGLYWTFIERNEAFFIKNPRLSMMVATWRKMDSKRQDELRAAAKRVRARLTLAPVRGD